jgi:tRNA A37 threonylcarbamoyladenosine modification protein TsaB
LARGVALLGISSIEALALQAQNQKIFGRISFIIDAQRNEFYLGAYEIDPAHLRPLEPVRLVSHTQLLSHAERGEILAGPEAERGSPRVQVLFPDAGALAKLAADRTDYISGERFEPIYLRETNFVKAPPPRTMPRS